METDPAVDYLTGTVLVVRSYAAEQLAQLPWLRADRGALQGRHHTVTCRQRARY